MNTDPKLPAVLLADPKYPFNVGNAQRACACFGVEQLWWTGDRVAVDTAQGERLPREERLKGYRNVELVHADHALDRLRAAGAEPVAVEVRENSECLTQFEHPDRAVYVFGPE